MATFITPEDGWYRAGPDGWHKVENVEDLPPQEAAQLVWIETEEFEGGFEIKGYQNSGSVMEVDGQMIPMGIKTVRQHD